MSSDRPIFVVGCPRSGTTLLTAMMHAHPALAMPPENRFLMVAYHERERWGDLREPDNRRALARWIVRRKRGRFADLVLERRAVVREIVDGPPTLGSALGIVLRAYARANGKRRWGDKRPAYWRDLGPILRLFPDAQIVNVVRDGRACVASLQQVSWWGTDVNGMISTWVQWDAETRRAKRRLPADSFHEVRYEDLVTDPRPVLQGLCAFLDEPFDEAMLRHAAAAAQIVPTRKDWHARVGSDLDASRVQTWREALDPAQVGLFEAVAGRRLERRGYPRVGGPRPTPGAVVEYYREHGRRLAALQRDRLADAVQHRRHPVPLAALLTSGERAAAGLPPAEAVPSAGTGAPTSGPTSASISGSPRAGQDTP